MCAEWQLGRAGSQVREAGLGRRGGKGLADGYNTDKEWPMDNNKTLKSFSARKNIRPQRRPAYSIGKLNGIQLNRPVYNYARRQSEWEWEGECACVCVCVGRVCSWSGNLKRSVEAKAIATHTTPPGTC